MIESKENKSLKDKIKSKITPKNLIIIGVTPIVLLPIVFGGMWAYKKFINK